MTKLTRISLFLLLASFSQGCVRHKAPIERDFIVTREKTFILPLSPAPTPPVTLSVPPSPKPKPVETPEKKHHDVIVVDAGHGGKDTGALSKTNKYEEKQLTLATARMVRNFLEELGYEAILTRESDTFVPLGSRSELANTLKASLFVSIHYNACDNPEVEGVEIFYYKDEKNPKAKRLVDSKRLGETVLSRIVKHTGAEGRGIKTGNLAVVRETKMPAILIEAGFLTSPKEREKLKDPAYQRYLAWGIAKGIDLYIENGKKTRLAER